MQKSRTTLFTVSVLVLALAACNMQPAGVSASNLNAAGTALAQTATALSQLIAPTSPATDTPILTSLATATDTPMPSPTQICDSAHFVSETVPDGSLETAGAAFTKTWRLQNIGACTWTSAYAVVFVSGDAMNAPSSVPLSGEVAPGQEVDINVNMQAPANPGDYTGNWSLRNASGAVFGLGASNNLFWVKISVPSPTDTPVPTPTGPNQPVPVNPSLPVSISQVEAGITIPVAGSGQAVVTCPYGSIVTGGGFAGSSSLWIYTSMSYANGWEADAQNLSGTDQPLNVYAECLSNTTGLTAPVPTQLTVSTGGVVHALVNCPTGSVVTGGGFAGNSNLLIYNDQSNGNGWQVYAQNLSGSAQLLNAYAVCLSGTSGSIQQVQSKGSASGNGSGQVESACPSTTYLTGGGFSGSLNLFFFSSLADGTNWQVETKNTASAAQALNSYAICLTLP